MPISRPLERPNRTRSLDQEADWITALAEFRELSHEQQLVVVLEFGQWVVSLRSDYIGRLEFHRETVRRALAMGLPRSDTSSDREWRVAGAVSGQTHVIG